ncbi:MAG: glycosyltransferase [Candidatus Methanofastidiosum sp.]|nr:glycosyltransferase [Methanofastidiosum sp.]
MKIAHLSVRHPASDTRVFHKECKILDKFGYSVYLVVPHEKDEEIDGINIVALPLQKKRLKKIFINIPLTLVKALKLNAKIYHFHDPELIPVGIILKIFRKKVIYDIHEDYYSDTFDKNWLGVLKRPVAISLLILQKIALRIFDYIIAAEPKIESRFKSNKTVLLRNFPILSMGNISINPKKNKDTFTIIYVGWLTRNRGIKEVIESLEFLEKEIELILLGKWEEGYKEECEKLKGWAKTRYLGYKSLEDTYSYINNSNLGISVLYPIPNYLYSLPVKAFEYMIFSLPIVMSDFSYWKEIYSECSLFVNPYDPKDIAEKINILLEDKHLREKLGKRGRELIETEYNWEKESEKLIRAYKDLS